MKLKLLCLAALVSLLTTPLFAEPSAEFVADAKALDAKFQAKIKQGLVSETAYAEELKGYDALLKKYQAEGPEMASAVLYQKSVTYSALLKNNAKAVAILQQIKREYPTTPIGKKADQIIATLNHAEESKKNQRSLFVSAVFPDFAEKDLQGYVVNTATLRGKVLFLDFGVTGYPLWSQQATNELLAAYKKYHAQGLEVISVSLDDSPAKPAQFARENGLPWKFICDGKQSAGALSFKFGIDAVNYNFPPNFLVDRYGHIFARTVAASEIDAAVAAALAYKAPAVKVVPASKVTNPAAANVVVKPAAPAPVKK